MLNKPGNIHCKQQGIVLVVALLILMVMTVVGVSMLSSNTLNERMASNMQQKYTTFQAADSCVASTMQQHSLIDQSVQTELTQNYDCIAAGNLNNVSTATSSISPPGAGTKCNGTSVKTHECVPMTITSNATLASGSNSTVSQVVASRVPKLNN